MLVAENPELWPELLRRCLGLEVDEDLQVLQGPETIRQLRASDHIVDGTAVFQRIRDGTLHEAVAGEIQRERDEDKWWTWPLHVAGLRARLRCPVTLVVLTPYQRTARWASRPIDLGRGRMKLHPLVVGPDQIPRSFEPDEARRHPALATLAVMVHGRRAGSKRLIRVTLQAVLDGMNRGEGRSNLLMDLIVASVHAKTLQGIEEEMGIEPGICFTKIGRRKFAEGLERGIEQGIERGIEQGIERGRRDERRQAIALVLDSRGLTLTPAQRRRLDRCSDDVRLTQWLRRAATVERAQQLFARSA